MSSGISIPTHKANKPLPQRLEFPPALFKVLVLVIAGGGWGKETDIARLGMGSEVGEGFFH